MSGVSRRNGAPSGERFETVVVGGGLHGGLAAAALLARPGGARVALVERGQRLAGDHTWCFFGSDLTAEGHALVAPFVAARWDAWEVRFPRLGRTVERPYFAITAEHFDAALRARFAAAPHGTLLLGTEVAALDGAGVTLADGRRLAAERVVDARGPGRPDPGVSAGWQTFLGLEVRLAPPLRRDPARAGRPGRPAVPAHPIIMDAVVAQTPGYRFFYVLPFAPDRLLVEETFFGDTPAIDEARLETSIRAWAALQGWRIEAVLRRERGALPMPWGLPGGAGAGSAEAAVAGGDGPRPGRAGEPVVIGYRGGWFHPGTGYSLPFAVRVALRLAAAPPAATHAALAPLARAHRAQAAFARALNLGLFRAVRPADRWRLLERFHRLPEDTMARFYRLDLTLTDRARLLAENVPEVGALLGGLRDRLGGALAANGRLGRGTRQRRHP